jgi:hypothetical protein
MPSPDVATLSVRRLSRRTPVARLAHTCELCGQTIQPGTRYVRVTGLLAGRLFCWRYHGDVPPGEKDPCRPGRKRAPFIPGNQDS